MTDTDPRAPGSSEPDALAREGARAERAAEDARRAERELLATRARIRELERDLAASERRLSALRGRRAVRIVTAVSARVDRAARALRRSGPDATAPKAPPFLPTRSFPDAAPREVPARYRAAMLAALQDPRGPHGPFKIVASGPIGDLGSALAAHGIEVVPSEAAGPDAIISTNPGIHPDRLPVGPIRIGVEPVDDPGFDILVPLADDPAAAVIEAIERWLRATRVSIRIPAANSSVVESWGDTHLARGMRAALRDAGWPTRLQLRSGWDLPVVGHDDVVLDLLGLHEASSRPGAVRVLWQISHPELARPDLYERYDTVFVASDPFAARMAELVAVPIVPLHQATDPDRFRPTAGGPAHELLFVGGWRQAGRRVLEDLLPTNHELAVYGGRWTPELIDPRYLAGGAIPNEDLAAHYAAAAIVLNDHWAGMRREGFLSNRLYDASAAGAFVISDDVEGLAAEFDGGVVGYRDRAHLAALVDRYLADPDARREHADRARAAVLGRHTFAHRARRFMDAVEPLLPGDRPR